MESKPESCEDGHTYFDNVCIRCGLELFARVCRCFGMGHPRGSDGCAYSLPVKAQPLTETDVYAQANRIAWDVVDAIGSKNEHGTVVAALNEIALWARDRMAQQAQDEEIKPLSPNDSPEFKDGFNQGVARARDYVKRKLAQQAQPLTDEQVEAIVDEVVCYGDEPFAAAYLAAKTLRDRMAQQAQPEITMEQRRALGTAYGLLISQKVAAGHKSVYEHAAKIIYAMTKPTSPPLL